MVKYLNWCSLQLLLRQEVSIYCWLITSYITITWPTLRTSKATQLKLFYPLLTFISRYSTQNLFYSDRGFKEIMRTKLKVMNGNTYQYNVTIHPVYSGISKEVNGLAIDWLSGSLYWTDALYNWISVCDSQRFEIYRHLITTGMDKPIGIAVYPQVGWVYIYSLFTYTFQYIQPLPNPTIQPFSYWY